ncbi:MAG: hypothetical protein L3J75_15130 [Methylococcaceae bacterium]|nr:hypothetical protein [Methylococcaceae bacterium]
MSIMKRIIVIILYFCFSGQLLAAVNLVMTSNPEFAVLGQRIEYTLTVTNTNASEITGVVLQNSYPRFVTVDGFKLTDGGLCSRGLTCQTEDQITWNIGTLASQTSRTIRFEARVQSATNIPANGTIITNSATLNYVGGSDTAISNVTAITAPALDLEITADRSPVVPSENITYRVTYGNRSTVNQLNTVLRAPIPVGTTFSSASAGGLVVNGGVEWNLNTVVAGASGERRFTVTVDAMETPGDVIKADAQLLDDILSLTHQHAETITALEDSTPVQLLFTSNTSTALPGERIEYALTVTNTSNTPVNGIVLEDLFPEFVNIDGFNIPDGGVCPRTTCVTGDRIFWTIGTLAAQTSRTVHFEAKVSAAPLPTDGTILTHIARLTYAGGQGTSKKDVTVNSIPSLDLSISADRSPVVPGETLTYKVNFGNRGTTNQLNTVLRVPIPAGTTFSSASAGGSIANGGVEWNLGTVIAGASGERRFTVTVDAAEIPGNLILAEAQLSDNTTLQTRLTTETITALEDTTPVQLLFTTNSSSAIPATDPFNALPADRIEYTLTVTNTSDLPVTNIVIKDFPPVSSKVSILSPIPDAGIGGDRITWNIGTLAPQTSRTVRFETKLSSPADGTILTHTATLAYDGGRGTAKKDIAVNSVPGLDLSISEDHSPVVPGETLTYRVTFGNRGTSNQLNTLLRIPIPAGTTFSSASAGGLLVNGGVEWNLGTVIAGTSGERRFTVTVDATEIPGDVILAEAQLLDKVTLLSRLNAETLTELEDTTPVQLLFSSSSSTMTHRSATFRAKDRNEYALTVTNTSNAPITGIAVENLFPQGVSISGFSLPDSGVTTGERGTWNIGVLAPQTSRTIRFETEIGRPAAGSVFTHIARLVYDGGRGTAKKDVTIHALPSLDLAISGDHSPVVPGETLTYRVTFGNPGLTDQLNTVLRVPLPVGTIFSSASSGGSIINGAVEWNLGTVLAGDSGERRFTVTIDGAEIPGNAILAEAQLLDSTTLLIRLNAETITELEDTTPVQLLLTANSNTALQGKRTEYALTVTNTSNNLITGVFVEDLLPENSRLDSFTLPDEPACLLCGLLTLSRVPWDVGVLAPQSSRTIRFEVDVGSEADGRVLTHIARLTYDGGRGTSTKDFVVNSTPSLDLSIAADRSPVIPGETLTYRVIFGNQSNTNIANLLLRAPLPANTIFLSATAGGSLVNGSVEWDLTDSLLSETIDERSFTVRVNGVTDPGSVVLAEAKLVNSLDMQTIIYTETSTAVQQTSNINLAVTAIQHSILPNDNIEYTLTVSNDSSAILTGIVVHSLIPEFARVDETTFPNGVTCLGPFSNSCVNSHRITWNIGNMAAQTSQTISFKVTTPNTSAGVIKNGTILRKVATLKSDGGSASSRLDIGVGTDIDVDRDGLPDQWETLHFGSLNATTHGDFDNDGLSNLGEYQHDTDPKDSDSDNDGMPDGFEVNHGLNPLNAADAHGDADNDGFSNLIEYLAGTSPTDALDQPTAVHNDFGADRKADILIRKTNGFLAMYEMDGAIRNLSAVGGLPNIWTVEGLGDFGGDGKSDILIRKSNGSLAMYEMDGAIRNLSSVGGLPLDWSVAGVGDFGGDGKADILIRNGRGFLAMYQMDGPARSLSAVGGLPLDWTVEGVGDFGGDGKADILIRNGRGFLAMYQMDGPTRSLVAIGGLPIAWTIEGIGDFSGDGKADILIRNTSGFLAMYQMNAASRTLFAIGGLPTNWSIEQVSDFGGDGKADILIRKDNGFLAMYQMDNAVRTLSAVGPLSIDWSVQQP